MYRYNLEFFDREFVCVHHMQIGALTLPVDYLSPTMAEVSIPRTFAVVIGDYIRITGGLEFFGIVWGVDQLEHVTRISYKPFLSLFDCDSVFDTKDQGRISLEDVLKAQIEAAAVNNSDATQNVPGLSVVTTTQTARWTLNIKPTTDASPMAVINMYNSLIARALSKYSIAIKCSVDINAKEILLTVGRVVSAPKVVELDLPNVFSSSVALMENKASANKATAVNLIDGSGALASYYLHPDGTYSQQNSNRIFPVVEKIGLVTDSTQGTFAAQAADFAAQTFGQIAYNNRVELVCSADDPLIDPLGMEYGQTVDIYHAGRLIKSVLTAREIGDTVKLTFGAFRVDLTKIVRELYNNGKR